MIRGLWANLVQHQSAYFSAEKQNLLPTFLYTSQGPQFGKRSDTFRRVAGCDSPLLPSTQRCLSPGTQRFLPAKWHISDPK